MKLSATATVTTTREIKLSVSIRRKLLTELHAFQELKAQRDAIDGALEMHKATIGRLRESTGETSLELEGFKITHVSPTRSTLDKKKLVELGCALAWIEEATVTKPTKQFDKVTCPGEKVEEF